MTSRPVERPMTRIAAGALLALLVLPLALPSAAAAPTSFTVNVVSARNLGCSLDLSGADLRVRVLVNDQPVLVTAEASDQDEPVFAATAPASATLPARIVVEVEEGEPAGFFSTTYLPCTVGAGGAKRAEFTYSGEDVRAFTARGDDNRSAEAVVLAGRDPPAMPAPATSSATDSVTLSWSADASGRATGHRVALSGAGPIMDASVEATRATLSGLCDNQEYALRVVRDTATWHVSSPDVRATTKNAAPQPPNVLSATRPGNLTWESRTTHDVARYEVHASAAAGFAPTSDTLRHSSYPFGPFSRQSATGVPLRATDAHVLVRVVDTGGLSADSPTFPVDGAPRGASFYGFGSCGGSFAGSPPAEQPQPEPETTTPTPPPSPTPASPTSPTPQPPCCRVDVVVDASASGMPRVTAGVETSLTLVNREEKALVVDLRLVDPSKGLRGEEPVQGTFSLDAQASRRVSVVLAAPVGMGHGERTMILQATAREESSPRPVYLGTSVVLVVPMQAWELREEDLRAVFEIRGAGAVVNVTPGGEAEVRVTLVNKADHPLVVTARASTATRFDADLGRAVAAPGFAADLAVQALTLEAQGQSTHVVRLRAPANATIGHSVAAQLSLVVNNTVIEASLPAGFEMRVAAAAAVVQPGGGLSTGLLVAGAVAAAGAGVGAFLWLRRDATRFALAAALYARLSAGETLRHPAREALQRRIAGEPGVCYTTLKRETGMNTGALVHHLRAMERAGYVTSRKEGAFRRFYASDAQPPAPRAASAATTVTPLTPMQQRVLEIVRAEALTQGEIAQRLGVTQQGASHHLKSLERAGHVEAFHDGHAWRYRVVATFEVLP